MALAKDNGAEREPTPCGLQNAICAFEVDIGMHVNPMSQKKRHQVVLFWELEETMSDGRPFMVSKIYTLSLNEKANLRKDIESWFGKKFTKEQALAGFDTAKLVGKGCTLTLVEDDKGYARVNGIAPQQKNATKLTIHNETPPEWVGKLKEEGMDMDAVNKIMDEDAAQQEYDDIFGD